MKFVVKHNFVFYLLSFTYGALMSIIGFLILLPFLPAKRVGCYKGRLYGVFPKSFGSGWGFEMGCFYFVSEDCKENLKLQRHELGHGLQNILLGPLMPILVSIPSVIRFWYRENLVKRGKPLKTAYDDAWFEGWATRWGEKYFGDSGGNK